MINLGLRQSELAKLIELLYSPHWIKVTVSVLDLEHNYLADLSDRLMSGQVDVDTKRDVTRTAELTFFDPESAISLNPDNPAKGALFLNRMIRIIYSVADPLQTKWYDIPLFCGPVTGLARDDVSMTVQCAGKDHLGYANVWDPRTYAEGLFTVDVIKAILTQELGENPKKIQCEAPRQIDKTDDEVVLSRETVPWKVVKSLARSIGYEAFYDGRGACVIRKSTNRPVMTFRDEHITMRPDFTYDPSTVKNSVRVVGGRPKGAENKIVGRATAHPSHPLSAKKLGRNGVPRYYTELIDDDKIKRQGVADRIAEKRLKELLIESVEMRMEIIPFPLLEEGDIYNIVSDDVVCSARAMQWSIPLTHDGRMSLGQIKKVSWRRKKTKRKPKGGRRHGGPRSLSASGRR